MFNKSLRALIIISGVGLLANLSLIVQSSAFDSPASDSTNPHLYRGMPYRRAEPAFMADIPDPFGLRPRTMIMQGLQKYEDGYSGFVDSLTRSATVTMAYEVDGRTAAMSAALAGLEYLGDSRTTFPHVSGIYADAVLRSPETYAYVHRTLDRTIDEKHPRARRALSVIPGARKIVHKVVDHKLKKLAKK
jgi:hypothetical protein